MRARLGRSVLVGLVATAVDMGTLALLISGCGVTPEIANVPALLAGVTVQFFGNKYYAFRDDSRRLLRQGSLFFVVECGTFVLNAAAFHLLAVVLTVPYYFARPAGEIVVYLGFSYPLWTRVFRDGRPGRSRGAARDSRRRRCDPLPLWSDGEHAGSRLTGDSGAE